MTRTGGIAVATALGWLCSCSREPPRAVELDDTSPCGRKYADKLGTPFVKLCPHDLSGVIAEPFWIAASPIGCPAGEHETIACPAALVLSTERRGPAPVTSSTVQLVDGEAAHRTCTLRFGGRLPTATELAQARAALGLVAVTVHETGDPPHRQHREVPEWVTAVPCTVPSRLQASCEAARTPAYAPNEPDWTSIQTCSARPADPAGALVVGPGDACPPARPGAPRCLLAPPATVPSPPLEVTCEPRVQKQHPPPATTARAAFRCVLPEPALRGTIVGAHGARWLPHVEDHDLDRSASRVWQGRCSNPCGEGHSGPDS